MTTREHFANIHKDASEHHRFLAENEKEKEAHHTALAKAHEEMGQPDIGKIHHKCAKSCAKAAEEHTAHADRHDEMCKSIAVSDLSKGGDRLIPDNVRGIATGFPAGITAVPRFGSPAPKAPDVPFEFRDLVKIEDDL